MENKEWIIYWTKPNGLVEFARDVNKNVQLFTEREVVEHIKGGNCLTAKVEVQSKSGR